MVVLVPVSSWYAYSRVRPVLMSIVTIRVTPPLTSPPSCASGLCIAPTSVRPFGVIASPSIPLLVTRPVVLPAISSAPTELRWLIANLSGSVKTRVRSPVKRSNSYTYGPYSSEM